ncbi:MAG: SUMF1/EgtB/PvdO family nonheme iron enzyme [Deltaproteobacteria bacterium]|nr:SUMF1/EgtB/PvdO family nonheme iron enzyme [Deltaproteobacteria bacterium]
MASERADAVLGLVLAARYRVEAVIGDAHAGGTVFRGRDVQTGNNVVIRCPSVPEELSGAALLQALDAFQAEAKTLRALSEASADVEKLLAAGVTGLPSGERVPFTVFEWLAGRSFERHLAERGPGTSSIGEAIAILEPAARALAAAHAMGVAHRDVRPANLWLAETGGRTALKVAAFGLATRVGPHEPAFAPEYGAPEHFKRSYGVVGPATDVYGLALCIVELVTGKRALTGADPAELYLATSDLGRRPTLRAHGASPSEALEAVIQRAVAVDPKRRWQSARELWDALLASVPELTPAAPSVRSGGQPSAIAEAIAAATPPPPRSLPAPVLSGVPSGASLPPLEDARLGDSARNVPPKSSERAAPGAEPKERGGTWAWLAMAVIGVIAIAVIFAKVGKAPGKADAGAPSAKPSAASSAPASSSVAASSAPASPSLAVPSASAALAASVSATPSATASAPASASSAAKGAAPPDMLKVTPGTFVMGSDTDGKGEKPKHEVRLTRAYYIDRTEVRADAYATCVKEKACTTNNVHTGPIIETAWGCNTDKDRPTHPANCVDRHQAEKYCVFAGKRLPTEAEWEYAARGSDGRDYPWGSDPPTQCTQAILLYMKGECSGAAARAARRGTWEVGTTVDGKSAFGALDMAGNVWEWVADGYESYPKEAVENPKVALGNRGVLRGGSWDYAVTSAKSTYRLPFGATFSNVGIGFRCAKDAE